MEAKGCMPYLHIFAIHTQKLTQRGDVLHGVIQTIRTTASAVGYDTDVRLILKPDPEHIQADLAAYDKRVSYDKVGIEEFDRNINVLSLEHISNFEKQRAAWKHVMELPATDVFMIIEDDAFFLPEAGVQGLQDVLANTDHTAYDFLTLSMSQPGAALHDFRESGKILPSKEAYFVSHRAARVLYEQSETIKMSMRYQMSYILHTNPSLRVMFPGTRAFIEGSKLGVFPSTVHNSNVLIYNKEFMELWQFVASEAPPPAREIREIYKKVRHMRNPDMAHLYGVLLYKANELQEAQDVMLEAIEFMKEKQGLLSFRSELLMNTINIHEFTQWDLAAISALPSKYDKK